MQSCVCHFITSYVAYKRIAHLYPNAIKCCVSFIVSIMVHESIITQPSAVCTQKGEFMARTFYSTNQSIIDLEVKTEALS